MKIPERFYVELCMGLGFVSTIREPHEGGNCCDAEEAIDAIRVTENQRDDALNKLKSITDHCQAILDSKHSEDGAKRLAGWIMGGLLE
jgi:hypothetical protein